MAALFDADDAFVLIWEASTAEEWVNQIMSIPLSDALVGAPIAPSLVHRLIAATKGWQYTNLTTVALEIYQRGLLQCHQGES